MISKEKFQEVVTEFLRRETSALPDQWSESNPSIGHCVVVALLAQDIFGGALIRASLTDTEFASGRYHYWNLLSDGSEVDFTEGQFEGRKPLLVGEVKGRESILDDVNTVKRYEMLKKAVLEVLRL